MGTDPVAQTPTFVTDAFAPLPPMTQ
jgi:hypothetical protein